MLLGRVSQQPSESRRYKLDYSRYRLDKDDYLANVTVAVSPDSVPPITASATIIQDVPGDITTQKSAYVYVSGGVSGTTYRITVTATLNDSNVVWEDELEVIVEEL